MAKDTAARIAAELFIAAVIGVGLGLLGPFGTFAMPLALRIAVWIGLMLSGYSLFKPLILIADWVANHYAVPLWLATLLALTLASLPMALLVFSASGRGGATAALSHSKFPAIFGQTWLIGLLAQTIYRVLKGRRQQTGQKPHSPIAATPGVDPAPSPSIDPPFHQRLRPGFGPVLALAGEDHYVRAIGATGEELVLVRLRDAVAELAGVEGMQVHRSWWVARQALDTVEREGRGMIIVLTNGQRIPVARERQAEVRAAGWLNARTAPPHRDTNG